MLLDINYCWLAQATASTNLSTQQRAEAESKDLELRCAQLPL